MYKKIIENRLELDSGLVIDSETFELPELNETQKAQIKSLLDSGYIEAIEVEEVVEEITEAIETPKEVKKTSKK